MPRRILAGVVITTACLATIVVANQSSRSPSRWSVPRTPDGYPDLQGVWANNVVTPLERPAQFGGRPLMTDAELADVKKRAAALMDGGDAFFGDELILAVLAGREEFASADTQTGNYDQTWLSERTFDHRTSLIVDPPDGRIPPVTAAATERTRRQAEARRGRGPADRVQDLSLSTRCISAGTPYIRAGYQSYFELVQGPGVAALRTEMIHDVRVFPIGDGPRLSPAITLYHGDSRASWDGDTLVVDTTNFSNGSFRGSSEQLHLVERFRRTAEDTLEYSITFDDPTVWTRPWTVMIPLQRTNEPLLEFACHEGNYSLRAILSGARAQER